MVSFRRGRGAAVPRRVTLCGVVAVFVATRVGAQIEFVPRNFSGEGNNVEFPAWGAAETAQIRAVAGAEYATDGFTPTITSPTAREVLTDVILTSTPGLSSKSVLFIAWGQLLAYDLSLTLVNTSESLDVPCNDADEDGGVDIWCPLGAASDDIPFYRSQAAVGDDGVRSPVNYASSYIDLDFVYGRSADEAGAYRTGENGLMNVTDSGVPYQNADGTWLIADQRPAQFPVTFALHIMLLLEHNRCCVEVAPGNGYAVDEDIYQACRGWTIAIFQHITQNDFFIRLLGITLDDLGLTSYLSSDYGSVTSASGYLDEGDAYRRSRRSRRLATTASMDYDETVNAGADVFVIAAGAAALESALPGTVRVVSEGFVSTDDDNIELSAASADMAGLFERNDFADVLRGAVLSPALDIDTYYSPILSNLSPLFKLPVDAVQRGRDHGLPSYNDAREAYGLEPMTTFESVTSGNTDLASRLSDAYGGDIDSLDAVTGALAEATDSSTGGVFGELLVAAWSEQLNRSISGDRFYHFHGRDMEDVANTTLSDVLARVTTATDLPLSVFVAPSITVCDGGCGVSANGIAALSDGFEMEWEEVVNSQISFTLRSRDIGNSGWMGIGLGGLTMGEAEDFIICEVLDDALAECTDRAYTTQREVPPEDANGELYLTVTNTSVGTDWTSVTFLRDRGAFDDEDYDLGSDIDAVASTYVIYAFREGDGIGQHPNANRGSATINFATGSVESECSATDFVGLHGALMLIAWMILAPLGIYYVRYRKGENIGWAGLEWFEMHEQLMIVASEAILPLGITAVFASGGDHDTTHAHWGYYVIVAVAVEIATGIIRTKGLQAKQANFSFLHRINKHFHIWAGRFLYLAGVMQCYRGLELVSSDDDLILSAGDGLDLEFGSFGWIKDQAFYYWMGVMAVAFLVLETRKQYRRFFKKGAANVCGCFELINETYKNAPGEEEGIDDEIRLVPRTEALPIYTMAEFNDKVLNGQSWVLVDGAIVDVSEFSHRHPGGARLILNAVGTDVTHELLGEEMSVGHAMSFSPQKHPESAWEIVRSLVVGYLEEDEEEAESKEARTDEGVQVEDKTAQQDKGKGRAFRVAAKAVMMQTRRTSTVTGDPQAKTSKINELAVLPDQPSTPSAGGGAGAINSGVPESPAPARAQLKPTWSSKRVLERFHVCPLLFREKMGAASSIGRGQLPTKRPTYRYIFSCPGHAQALVEAIRGVCHFNMRGIVPGKGVIQRSYNAYAVRVQGLGDEKEGRSGKGVLGTPRVIPAQETSEGVLCIEMRIRIYHDGAMSQLLERLSKDEDNPAVQLQGPFIVSKLVPPPAHRNVVMIAAGTGINPMVQQIRDYLALPRDASHPLRSRLCLVWQSTSEAEFYGAEEITAMQAKSQGLLEVTVLVSGEHRRKNVPGAAFRKGGKLVKKVRAIISPMSSGSHGSFQAGMPAWRLSKSYGMGSQSSTGRREDAGTSAGDVATFGEHGRRKPDQKQGKSLTPDTRDEAESPWFGRHPHLPPRQLQELTTPSRRPRHTASNRSEISDVGGGLVKGKVTRDILDKVFGPTLLATLEDYNREERSGHTSSAQPGGGPWSQVLEEAKRQDRREGGARRRVGIDALAGTTTDGGKLQVVLSGPSGFVFYVEAILAEMGVPSGAIVLLD